MIRKGWSAPGAPVSGETAEAGPRGEPRDVRDPFDDIDETHPDARADGETRTSSSRASRRPPFSPGRRAAEGDVFERDSESGSPAARRSASDAQRPGRSLKGRALAYLSRREYSRAELSRKLVPFAEDADALEALLDALVRDGWLSDTRFAESVVHRRAARSGANRIVSELKRHAVGDALIEQIDAQLRETELVRAQAVWRKKYGQLPATPAERARQARFLAARGFSLPIIGKILKGIDDWADG
ncbi:recombination regulator RecX [Paraburkholderia caballeronis]|uniref:recombination regulator RecX n=1 Tax=Paraburkholderia caballeronis TaxID=416943 RepID=UPI0010654E62|nr:recombination regulator RecX [Paraburkholderia caballeronis]TDV01986.1 regulatory protein [Paraburkholderia caballeronis]TDV06290.1 regulatory protein [Paraburkholderia caballeronis]TDV16115.1 regulatory protein [Paraburkholderia caballeronis]